MRVIVVSLALIGLVVVFLVAGCVGLIGFGVAKAVMDVPPHATHEQIRLRHAGDLALIHDAIHTQQFSGLAGQLSSEVLALYRKDEELLKRQQFSGKSTWTYNDAGIGRLRTSGGSIECVVLHIPGATSSDDYVVCFIDRPVPSQQAPAEQPAAMPAGQPAAPPVERSAQPPVE